MNLFFATDVHGSEICWKKFINAGKFYKADVLILGGDMTGKAIVPIIAQGGGKYKVTLLDQETILESQEDINKMVATIQNRGYYPYIAGPDETSVRPRWRMFAMAMRQLGPDAEKIQVLFVTVDPERDTPELLAKDVPSFNPTFLGLHADEATLARLAQEFKVVYQKNVVKGPSNYLIDLSAGTYVYDRHGRIRLYMAYGTGPKAVAQDLRTLLAQN